MLVNDANGKYPVAIGLLYVIHKYKFIIKIKFH